MQLENYIRMDFISFYLSRIIAANGLNLVLDNLNPMTMMFFERH